MEWIGKKATGTRWDRRGGRDGFKGHYKYGHTMRGVITRYRKRDQQYQITGTRYAVIPDGEFRIGRGKEWFYRDQIEIVEEQESGEGVEREKDEKNNKPSPSG
jgi:hypothetical protein